MLAQMVGSFLLPKDEKAIIDAAKQFMASKIGTGFEGSFEDVIAQLKGDAPMSGVIHKVIEFVVKGAASPLWTTAIGVALDNLEAKGFSKDAVSNLVARLSNMVGVDPHLEGDAVERVAITLGNVANGCAPKYAPVVGALVVCPDCGYTHLI